MISQRWCFQVSKLLSNLHKTVQCFRSWKASPKVLLVMLKASPNKLLLAVVSFCQVVLSVRHQLTTNILTAYPSNTEPSRARTTYVPWKTRNLYTQGNSTCIVVNPEQDTTASSSSDSQLLWVSKWMTEKQIIPFSNAQLKKENDKVEADRTDQTRAYANTWIQNVKSWQGITTNAWNSKPNHGLNYFVIWIQSYYLNGNRTLKRKISHTIWML